MKAMHGWKDCTWCKHRVVYKKAIQRRYELEKCALSGATIAPPTQSLKRRCERWQGIGCECEQCKS